MAILTIDGNEMPEPSKLEVTISNLTSDTSGRNTAGEMLKDFISEKRKISASWNFMNMQEISVLLKAVDGQQHPYFEVAYPDPKLGQTTVKTFYVGDQTAPLFAVIDGVAGWQGVSMEFNEK